MAADDSKPFVTSFLGKKKITSSEFITIFQKYDQDGKICQNIYQIFLKVSNFDLFTPVLLKKSSEIYPSNSLHLFIYTAKGLLQLTALNCH